MRTLHQLIATSVLLVQFHATAQSNIIYQNDFSGTINPGWSRTTIGDSDFANTWSVTPSLESESGNQYARFDINVPVLPSNPNARWYGGFFTTASSMTALPPRWQLSFDISLSAVEPVQVSFQLSQGRTQFPPSLSPMMNYWVQPSEVGWQRVVIDQNTDYSLSQSFSSLPAGTYLRVSLASHDSYGNPLSISQTGTHDFLLDNVVLQSVPEPCTLGLSGMAAAVFIGVHQYRTKRPRRTR